MCLEVKDKKYVDSKLEYIYKNLSEILKDLKDVKLTCRKEDIKLFIDFKIKKSNFFTIFEDAILNIDLSSFYIKFKNNLNLNELLKLNANEYILGLFSFFLSIKCKFIKLELLIQLISSLNKILNEFYEKENYIEHRKQILLMENVIKVLIIILHMKNQYYRFNYSLNKLLKFIEPNLKDCFDEDYNKIKNIDIYMLKRKLFENLNLDVFSIKFLFVKYQSGFILNLKADGLSNAVNEIKDIQNKDIPGYFYKEDNGEDNEDNEDNKV